MAENTNKTGNDAKVSDNGPGHVEPTVTDTAETAVAEANGLSEGDVKALRHEAGLNQLAGNEANTLAWQVSPAGKEFAKGEKDRVKAAKDEEKSFAEQVNKDGLSDAEVKYKEAADKA